MQYTQKEIEQTLVSFHIGRGGAFYNAGIKSLLDINKDINHYTDDLFTEFENINNVSDEIGDRENLSELLELAIGCIDDLNNPYADQLKQYGLDLGNVIYVDASRNEVGLDRDNDGTGCIDIDGDYDTTYVLRLVDCEEEELGLILESNFVPDFIKEYCEERLYEVF